MKKAVVITTINKETDSIRSFKGLLDEWEFIIIGDKKTPTNENLVSIEDQSKLNYSIINQLPFNHYSRKNIGYLIALEKGAQVIYDTDDDNKPYDDWDFPESKSYRGDLITGQKYVNIYKLFNETNIWPRGYPLRHIRSKNITQRKKKNAKIAVWQGLADLDPDVDAIYRLIYKEGLVFDQNAPIVLDKHCYSPFNSQNTYWHRYAMPYAYLPITVSFRFTDILRGYIAQRCLWEHDLHLGFTRPTVFQERNQHDLLKDFQDELECYLNIEEIVSCLDMLILKNDYEHNLMSCYSALLNRGFVKEHEIYSLKSWIEDIKRVI